MRFIVLTLLALVVTTTAGLSLAPSPRRRFVSADRARAALRAPAAGPAMGMFDWLGELFGSEQDEQAGSMAAGRLKLVLAADRSGLDETTMGKIRAEIQAVIAKYTNMDEDLVAFEIKVENTQTLCTATFPLKSRPPAKAAE